MKLKKILLVITAMSVMLCGCSKAEPSSSDNNNGNNDVTASVTEETAETNAEGEYVSYGDGISDEDKVLDVFENIRLSYEGFSPNISVSVDTSKMRGFLQDNVTYTVKPDNGLKNGDKVIVTAMYNNSVMKSHDYVVKKDVLEMTIDGKEVSAEDIIVIDGEMLKYYSVIYAEPSFTDDTILMGASCSMGTKEYKGAILPPELCIQYNRDEYKKVGENFVVTVESYNKEYAQENGYVIEEGASFEVPVWNPNERNNEGFMWYEEDGTEKYSYNTPDF